MSDIDHTRDCVLPSDGRAERLAQASKLFALAAERDRLKAEAARLRAALEKIVEIRSYRKAEAGELFEIARAALTPSQEPRT
jgi:hypothetical protein